MPMEIERQWVAQGDVTLPDEIGPFRGDPVEQREIVDVYLDTSERALRAAGARLRLRTQDGIRLATFKRDGGAFVPGQARRREEIETAVGDDPEASEPFRAARELAGGPLAEVGTLRQRRAARVYRDGEHEVEAVVDDLLYPDGSRERRVEAEGAEDAVEAFAAALAPLVDGLEPARTSKGEELARRLGA
jgi:inorganic triphosphatase YgiF